MCIRDRIKAIQIAQEFLKTAYGQAAVDNLLNKEFLPEATFYPETNKWDVFFTNGVGSTSVELDKDLAEGTICRLDGKIYRRESSQRVTIYKLPLFTLSEFAKIVKLPHNDFRDELTHQASELKWTFLNKVDIAANMRGTKHQHRK